MYQEGFNPFLLSFAAFLLRVKSAKALLMISIHFLSATATIFAN